MPPPEKKPRADPECEWDDFDDVPFEVVEQAEVIASQIFGKRVGGDGSAAATTSTAACSRLASTPKIAAPTAKLGAASASVNGPQSRTAAAGACGASERGVGGGGFVGAPPSSCVPPKALGFRRINSSPEIPVVASAPAASVVAAVAAVPKATPSAREQPEKVPTSQLEVERLGQCLLMRDGEIKMLRSSLKQKASELTRLKQDRLVDLQSQSSAESERERELRRQIESLRTQLQFQDRELAELRFHLSSASRRQQTQSVGGGAVSPVRPGVSVSPSTSVHAVGFPSSKSFYGPVRKVTFDDAHRSPEKLPSAIKPLTEPGEKTVRVQPGTHWNDLVTDLLACGFCDLILADVHPAALEVIDKRKAMETAHRARRSMQRLLAYSAKAPVALAATSDNAIGSQNAPCDFVSFLSATEIYVGSYAGLLRWQQQQQEQIALGPTVARPSQAKRQLQLRKAPGVPAPADAAIGAAVTRVDAGGTVQVPAAAAAAAAERAERCLLGLCHLADGSVDVCEVLLGSGSSTAMAADFDSRRTACRAQPLPNALDNNAASHAKAQPGLFQLFDHVITCADLRIGQDDSYRLRVCVSALQLLLTLCCSSGGDSVAAHVTKEACSRFTSLVQDGVLAAALHSPNASVVQAALALLTPIIMQDGGTQASLFCCPSTHWCVFELVNGLLSNKYSTHTTDVHLQALRLLSCLCMVRSCHELLTTEPVVCPSHKQVVSNVVTLIYPHVLAYEESHFLPGHGCNKCRDALGDTCMEAKQRDISGYCSVHRLPPSLDRLVLQQGLHVLHALSQIDRRFSSRHATVEHEYVYVMNFASDLYKEQRKALGAASQLSSTVCTDEESLIDSLWDFEYDEDSDDKEAMATG